MKEGIVSQIAERGIRTKKCRGRKKEEKKVTKGKNKKKKKKKTMTRRGLGKRSGRLGEEKTENTIVKKKLGSRSPGSQSLPITKRNRGDWNVEEIDRHSLLDGRLSKKLGDTRCEKKAPDRKEENTRSGKGGYAEAQMECSQGRSRKARGKFTPKD